MNFSQIKCFLAAAECLSFTRAADRLYLSQPVLSRQIAAMEDEIGIELFAREKKSVKLTPAGEIIAEGLAKLAHEYQQLIDKATALHKGFTGTLDIGLVEGQLICPPYSVALTRFHDKYPDVRVNLSKHTMAGMREAIINGDIDIAFTAKYVLEGDELEFVEVGTARTMLVIPKSHPLASASGLTLEDFKNDMFLTLPESESPYVARASERRASHDSFNPKTLEAPNIGALALWLEAGYGIFPLNVNHALRNNPNLVFKDIPELENLTEIVLWKKGNPNPLISAFVEQFDNLQG